MVFARKHMKAKVLASLPSKRAHWSQDGHPSRLDFQFRFLNNSAHGYNQSICRTIASGGSNQEPDRETERSTGAVCRLHLSTGRYCDQNRYSKNERRSAGQNRSGAKGTVDQTKVKIFSGDQERSAQNERCCQSEDCGGSQGSLEEGEGSRQEISVRRI